MPAGGSRISVVWLPTGIALGTAVANTPLDQAGLHRLGARAAVQHGRGNGALAKLGAMREAVLRQSSPAAP